jgi:hypothetical protein
MDFLTRNHMSVAKANDVGPEWKKKYLDESNNRIREIHPARAEVKRIREEGSSIKFAKDDV